MESLECDGVLNSGNRQKPELTADLNSAATLLSLVRKRDELLMALQCYVISASVAAIVLYYYELCLLLINTTFKSRDRELGKFLGADNFKCGRALD